MADPTQNPSNASSRRGLFLPVAGAIALVVVGGAVYLLTRDAAEPPPPTPAPRVEAPRPAEPAPVTEHPAPQPPVGAAPIPPPAVLVGQRLPELPTGLPPGSEEDHKIRELMHSLVAEKTPAIGDCIQRTLNREARPPYPVVVTVQVTPPHHVGRIQVKDKFNNKEFDQCVARSMRSVKVPDLPHQQMLNLDFGSHH
jgi:type IV secretory pathway VirB10-like protein